MVDYEMVVQIMPQYRKNSYFDWMVENYLRHLEVVHTAVKCKTEKAVIFVDNLSPRDFVGIE